ncbi:energy transducer TonB [Marinifilum caeruleilacunae]|uniref:Energy transducer TonB n=1 Tax=Marinifilum caeruleilacunae TaxID=2499076 RepID=A0ABX1WZK6_9BACT|nr:energy transducer TonB [Marinifilum caeruleilacunae]NOU61555.1 energy transducer TonB [Marinifilum caeruleilacunae]
MKSFSEIGKIIVEQIKEFVPYVLSEFRGFLKRNKYGVMGTLAFHMILLILLFSFKLHTKREFLEAEIFIDIPPEVAEQILEEKEEEIKKEIEEKNSEINESVDKLLRSIAVNQNVKKSNSDPKQKVEDMIDEIKKNLDEYGSDDNSSGDDGINEYKKDSLSLAEEREKQRLLDSLQSIEYSGPSSVYYSLEGRHKIYLPIPVFKCEGEGKIVVSIGVNRSGRVVEAKILEDQCSVIDDCLFEAAIDATKRSRFNVSNSSPQTQKGTITYQFVKQ